MASYLQVENLTKSFGADVLFASLTFGIDEGEKIGLIAKNGMGKTTLLNILAGADTPDSGTVVYRNDLRVGYLPQWPVFPGAQSVMDTCLAGDDTQSQAVRHYEYALATDNSHALTQAIQEMDNAAAWDYEERFKQILTMLKINDFNQRIDQLSGGQIKRVALAKLLISDPQMLILDEPTNHLDIEMIEWLENYLSRSYITLLMVTHDRYFLDNVCNRILEIDRQHIFSYEGNYNYYLRRRAERLEAESAAVERARNLLRTELDWMRRQPQARAHKAQYRIDAFYDLKQRAQAPPADREVRLDTRAGYIGNKIFTAHDVTKRFGDKVILDRLNYTFARYEKLGIVGDNGVGKSTFIKMLLGLVAPDDGHFDVGTTVRFGYYSQEGITFRDDQRVIDAARDIAEVVAFDERNTYTASQFLNMFLFTARDQQKLIAKLSGGERRRLYLATVLMRKPNFLILDEPTNDLDIQTLAVLEDYLAHFKGCVIVVSHDRYFMDRTVDHIWVMQGQGVIKDFPGNYSEYRAWREAHVREAAPRQRAAKPADRQPRPNRERGNRLTFKEKKELEALNAELEQLNAEKAALDALFASGDTISDAAGQAEHYRVVTSRIDELETRWLELGEKDDATD
ncbi:MAG: ABC-F family ATP-binding cassette domain-containing protein [Muribaculaceae bacterium]|nr:ABC-F family ATP-binding cassette domain-containing protein [Muribaculaceae bacterium]